MKLGRRFGWPLLSKELVEQAARKRTYVVRVVYAMLLFAGFGIGFFHIVLGISSSGPVAMLGSGATLFQSLMILQFSGIYLFLPAMMAGVITSEKERESLALLFLTDMGPWAILLQKYLGRLVPMFTFLLLSLPLLGVAYSLGGVSSTYLASGIYFLFLTCLQVGAFALMCSAYCRTTVGAGLTAYLLCAASYLVQLIGWYALRSRGQLSILRWGNNSWYVQEMLSFFPPWTFVNSTTTYLNGGSWSPALSIWLSTFLFLVLARVFLTRRAFAPPRNTLLDWFKRMDGFMKELNKHFGNIMLVKDRVTLPDMEPVAWRETTKRSLGKVQYVFRLFVLLEVPTAFLGYIGLTTESNNDTLALLVFTLWMAAALLLSLQGANAIASERTTQTLDVLLTTPLTGREIIRQKARALQRLMIAMAVPFLTVFALETWWRINFGRERWLFMVASVLSLLVYLPMLAWISLWIGLKVRTRFRATMVAVMMLVCWCAVPTLVMIILEGLDVVAYPPFGSMMFWLLLSPARAIIAIELSDWRELSANTMWFPIYVNFCFYAAILYYVRWRCLVRADRYLRNE